MKKIYIISLLIILIAFQTNAQEENRRSGILNAGEQSIGLATGIDYAMFPLKLTYKRGFHMFNYKFPVNVGADVTMPIFKFDLNDIRIRLITETTLLRKRNFEIRGGIDPMFVNVKMETETMSSIGADFHVFTGFTNEKWNAGLQINYNQIFTTYIKHTDKFKEVVFEAQDGWYKRTASNIRLGVLLNRTLGKFDLYINAGISKTGKFNDYMFVPSMYGLIGLNYRF